MVSSDFERTYVYDFADRIRRARTGYEARNQQPQDGDKLPYHLDYTYDAFDHNTERSGTICFGGTTAATEDETQSWSSSTNRVSGWTYDASGNTTYSENTQIDSSQNYTYNAAGAMLTSQADNHHSSTRWTDGVQRPLYFGQTGGTTSKSNYLIYSTVFGKVFTEIGISGAKEKTYVHDLSGNVIAVQQVVFTAPSTYSYQVRWEHTDPSGASYMQTFDNGTFISTASAELDPTDRAVQMVPNGDSEEDDDGIYGAWGNQWFCKDEATPENCTVFASNAKPAKKDDDDKPPDRPCDPGFGWVKGPEGWKCEKGADPNKGNVTIEAATDRSDQIWLEPWVAKTHVDKKAWVRRQVRSALSRLNKPQCKKFIQGDNKDVDPTKVLNDVFERDGGIIKVNSGSIGGAVAQSNVGAGSNGQIRLSEQWSAKEVGGWTGHLNTFNTQTLVILHELRHLVGTGHNTYAWEDTKLVPQDDGYFYRGIAKNCFGVKVPADEQTNGFPF